VGVGWGDYVVAWLISYNGADCALWRLVLEKCVESELCREVIEMLPSIGLSIIRHKCYAETINTEVTEADQHLNQALNHSHNNPSQPQQLPKNHANAQKQSPSKPKRLSPRNKHQLKHLEIKAPPLGPPFLNPPHPIGGPPQTEGLTGFRGSLPRNCMWRGSKKG